MTDKDSLVDRIDEFVGKNMPSLSEAFSKYISPLELSPNFTYDETHKLRGIGLEGELPGQTIERQMQLLSEAEAVAFERAVKDMAYEQIKGKGLSPKDEYLTYERLVKEISRTYVQSKQKDKQNPLVEKLLKGSAK